MKKEISASEWRAALDAITGKEAEEIPDGFVSRTEAHRLLNLKSAQGDRSLKLLVEAGTVKKLYLRTPTAGGIKRQAFYKKIK